MKRITAIIFVLTLLVLGLSGLLIKHEYYKKEMRTELKLETKNKSLSDGELTRHIEEYLNAEKTPLKEEFTKIASQFKKITGINEIKGVIVSDRLYRIPPKNPSLEKIAKKMDNAKVFLLPHKIYYADNLRIAEKIKKIKDEYIKYYHEKVKELNAIDLSPILNINDYYITDHHLNEKGVKKLLEYFGNEEEIIERDHGRFVGGLYRLTQINRNEKFISIETKNKKSYTSDREYPVYNDEKIKEDSYSYYMGGNYGKIDIKGSGKNNLTVIKDSFFNPLAPFISEKYKKLRLIDNRFLRGKIEENLLDGEVWIFYSP